MEELEQSKSGYASLMTALVVGGFMTTLGMTGINVALPYLMEDYGVDLNAVKWAMTGFVLATGIIAPITSYFGEKFSYKRLYLIAVAGFTLSAVLCAISWNIQLFVTFRVLQGLCTGLAMSSTMALIYQVIPREKQASAMSLWAMTATLAPAFGPTISGFLIDIFSWQAIFLFNIPLGIFLVFLIIRKVPYYRLNPPAGLDIIGFVTCLAASVLLLIGFSEGAQRGWLSAEILSFLIAGAIILTIFIIRELRVKSPMLNLSVLKSARFSLSVITRSIALLGLYSGTFLLPLFLQEGQGLSALDAGVILLPSVLAMALCTLLAGKLYNRMDPRILTVGGFVLAAAGTFALAHLSVSTSTAYAILLMMVRQTGSGVANTPVTMLGMEALDKKDAGAGSALSNWIAQSISCLAVGVFASLQTYQTNFHIDDLIKTGALAGMSDAAVRTNAFVMGVNDTFFVSALIIAVAIPLSIFLKRQPFEEAPLHG